jgi:hypothetical protein
LTARAVPFPLHRRRRPTPARGAPSQTSVS